jgi:hypothetical protein
MELGRSMMSAGAGASYGVIDNRSENLQHLPARLYAGRNVIHVSFLREERDKLLHIRSLRLCGGVEFSDDFFIAKHL